MPLHAPARLQVKLDAALAGPLFMLAAALLFTVLNLLIKLLGPQYTVWHIGFYRFGGGALVLLALFGRYGNPFRARHVRLLVIRGCTGSAAFICLVTAIRELPISTALVIFYAYPAVAAIFAFLLYNERIGRLALVCVALVVAGIAVLLDFHLTGGLLGQVMALVGAVFAGFTVTLIRSLREHHGPVVIYLYFCAMGTLVTLPAFAAHPVWPATPAEGAMIAGIVLVSVIAQLLMNQGFFYCRGWEGGVFMASEVVFTAVVGIAWLGDPATWRFWTGGLMVFASVVALNRLRACAPGERASIKALE
jgi:drug/metabolite transporter (DMT)-like permease